MGPSHVKSEMTLPLIWYIYILSSAGITQLSLSMQL